MQHLLALTTAQARFEAARKLTSAPSGHPSRMLHGHSFIATASGLLTPREIPYTGAQAHALSQRLQDSIQALNYRDLNEVLDDPNDTALALWIFKSLNLDSLDFVGIQSTRTQGVTLTVQSGNRFESLTHDTQTMHTARLWRRYQFRAAHQLPNVSPGHKCGRMHGHGFQVVLQADTSGSITYEHLDQAWDSIASELDMRCLNDIEGLSNPTSEILSAWIWHRLKSILPELSWVSVYETASCGAQFDGQHFRIWKDFSIDSAIRFKHAPAEDPRHQIHGDTFLLRLHLSGDLDQVMGWTMDFGDVKTAFEPIFKALDHRPLYDQAELVNGDAESIAQLALTLGKQAIPSLIRVDVVDSLGAGTALSLAPPGPTLPV